MVDTQIFRKLKRLFYEQEVKSEWSVVKNSEDAFTRSLYAPRLDFVVGPFNIDMNSRDNVEKINLTANKYKSIFPNVDYRQNINPRCFIAVEVESDSTSRKHKLGSIINASSLGKVGLVIGTNENAFQTLTKIREYLNYLHGADKSTVLTDNVVIMTRKVVLDMKFQKSKNTRTKRIIL